MNKKYISTMLCALCLGTVSFSMEDKTNHEEINQASPCKTSFEKKIDAFSIYELVGNRIKKHIPFFGNKAKQDEETKKFSTFTWNLIKNIYESRARHIEGNKCKSDGGQSFSMHPEFFYELLTKCEGKNVFEIGGAQGEHAILFALAGANNVYLNELATKEMEVFMNLKKNLPQIFQDKFKCFNEDIFITLPKLENEGIKFDIVQMRSLLHFFGEKQEQQFFTDLKPIIKEGTLVYISTNGDVYIKKENTNNTYFNHLIICARTQSHTNIGHMDEFFSMPPEGFNNLKNHAFQNCNIFPEKQEKNVLIWNIDHVMKTLKKESPSPVWDEEEIELKVEALINETSPLYLFANLSHARFFSIKNLVSLIEKQNFIPIISSSIFNTGHATIGFEAPDNHFSGVLSKYKGENNTNNKN